MDSCFESTQLQHSCWTTSSRVSKACLNSWRTLPRRAQCRFPSWGQHSGFNQRQLRWGSVHKQESFDNFFEVWSSGWVWNRLHWRHSKRRILCADLGKMFIESWGSSANTRYTNIGFDCIELCFQLVFFKKLGSEHCKFLQVGLSMKSVNEFINSCRHRMQSGTIKATSRISDKASIYPKLSIPSGTNLGNNLHSNWEEIFQQNFQSCTPLQSYVSFEPIWLLERWEVNVNSLNRTSTVAIF